MNIIKLIKIYAKSPSARCHARSSPLRRPLLSRVSRAALLARTQRHTTLTLARALASINFAPFAAALLHPLGACLLRSSSLTGRPPSRGCGQQRAGGGEGGTGVWGWGILQRRAPPPRRGGGLDELGAAYRARVGGLAGLRSSSCNTVQ